MHHRLREQIIQFESHAGRVLAGNFIASLMLVFLINPVVDSRPMLAWLALQLGFNLLRFGLTLHHRKRVLQTEEQIHARYRHYLTMVLISAALWGLSAFLLFPDHASEYQLLYLLIVVGFTATAMSLVNILPGAYPLLILVIFACIFIKLAITPTQFTISLSLVLVFFVLFMLSAAQSFRRNLEDAIGLRIKLEQQAIRDALTGVYNRRYFMQQLKHEWQRCTRHQQAITILLIDIDHFKKINDRYGHQQGDRCLVEIAALLDRRIRRSGEFLARIGGEEFAIVLPNARPKAAVKLAEKLRNDISLLNFQHKKQRFQLSVSMGIACTTPQLGSDCEKLFLQADQALYQVKQEGRNNYRVANGSCPQTD